MINLQASRVGILAPDFEFKVAFFPDWLPAKASETCLLFVVSINFAFKSSCMKS